MRLFAIFIGLMASTAVAQDMLNVICGQDAIIVGFSKQVAMYAHYVMDYFHLNDINCTFDEEKDGYYIKTVSPLSSCGTQVLTNDTHATFINVVSHSIPLQSPQQENQKFISIKYECVYQIDLRLGLVFIPNITVTLINLEMQSPSIRTRRFSSLIQIPDIIEGGGFQVAMAIYKTAAYREVYTDVAPTLQPDETVFVGITMLGDASSDLFILMRMCWATAFEDPNSEPYYNFIEDSCPLEGVIDGTVKVTQNGVGHQAMWQTGVFKFVATDLPLEDYTNVWLHCDITICVQTACPVDCSVGERSKRSTTNEKIYTMSAVPLNIRK